MNCVYKYQAHKRSKRFSLLFLIRRQNEISIERNVGRQTCHSNRAETVVVMRNKPQEAEIDIVKVCVCVCVFALHAESVR